MAILFASDMHFEDQRPDILRAFFGLLEEKRNGLRQLYLLGDIFEVWLGDDTPLACADALAVMLQSLADGGVEIFLMHGNRDFLLGEDYARRCGATLIHEPYLLDLAGRKAVLMHGDALCTLDTEYMAFRAMVRNPQWIREFLASPLQDRIAIGRALREKSQQSAQQKQDMIMDVTQAEVTAVMERLGVDLLIHGHTHRPAVHDVPLDGKIGQRIVLGDWYQQGWYLQADATTLQLHSFPFEPT